MRRLLAPLALAASLLACQATAPALTPAVLLRVHANVHGADRTLATVITPTPAEVVDHVVLSLSLNAAAPLTRTFTPGTTELIAFPALLPRTAYSLVGRGYADPGGALQVTDDARSTATGTTGDGPTVDVALSVQVADGPVFDGSASASVTLQAGGLVPDAPASMAVAPFQLLEVPHARP